MIVDWVQSPNLIVLFLNLQLSQLYAEYIRVSITAVFELFLVAKQVHCLPDK